MMNEALSIMNSSLGSVLRASDPQGAYEVELQGLWSRIPLGERLLLADGRSLLVLSRGTWNVEAGPDFKNAKLSIDGRVLRGDVEVHRRSSDWLRHGHSSDPAYATVALHVVEVDDGPLSASPSLPVYVLNCESDAGSGHVSAHGRCARHFSSIPAPELKRVFADAGLERLRRKADEALASMIEGGETKAYLSKLFDALGFKSNRPAFAETLKRFLTHPPEARLAMREALLWGESGLLPDPSKLAMPKESEAKAKALWRLWWPLRISWSAPVEWRRASVRPLNSPERRLACAQALLAAHGENPLPLFARKLADSSPADFNAFLREAFIAHDPFWDSRSSFVSAELERPAAVCGSARALDAMVDVVYPCLLAKFKLDADRALETSLCDAYLALPRQESNRVFKNALERWFVEPAKAATALSGAAEMQGALHLYGAYCDKIASDCEACLIFNSL